jgi:hypothetical protein
MTPNTRKITPNAVNPTPISAETKIQAMNSKDVLFVSSIIDIMAPFVLNSVRVLTSS